MDCGEEKCDLQQALPAAVCGVGVGGVEGGLLDRQGVVIFKP